jgi:hypothetical protein
MDRKNKSDASLRLASSSGRGPDRLNTCADDDIEAERADMVKASFTMIGRR